MNAPLPPLVMVGVWALAGMVLALALYRGGAQFLRSDGVQQRALVLACVVMCGLRAFNTLAVQGVLLSFLGAAAALLMFGPARGTLLLALVSALMSATGNAWHGFAPDFLVNAALPLAVAWGLMAFARRRLPAHVFVFTLVNGFLGGALSMAAAALAKAALTAWWGDGWPQAYVIATIPMMFGEGFLTGGAMALLVAYRPEWVSTFDDARYLARRE